MLKVRNLTKVYYTGIFSRRSIFALNNLSFDVNRGDIFGIVGESGSGKTTVAKILLRLIEPDHGSVYFDKQNLLTLNGEKLRRFRQRIQAVPQNYESALNPRMKIDESLKEVFLVKGKTRCKEITRQSLSARLNEVGLKEEHLDRYPAQLSGGQLQRVNIARVMALEPELIIADEPTSNLDVSVQAQIIHLMLDLKRKTNSTLIFISHDLDLISLICDRVAVMRKGEIVAIGVTEKILNHGGKKCLFQ
ncbi:MAG: ABC transporter ATP-binding protein [Syntrophobacterales bacterium]|nr:ABC transporter ATP-binding protein [Syntrophobacterales bacterium]